MVIIWTHDDGTNQTKDASKAEEELNDYTTNVDSNVGSNSNSIDDTPEVTKGSHDEKTINNSDSKIDLKRKFCNMHVINAVIHNEICIIVGDACC